MTVNVFQEYDAVGNREDLADYIKIVAREETVAYDMFPKTKATAHLHEWQTDTLEEPQVNAANPGADATPEPGSVTTRLGNYTQIFQKTVAVAGTQEAVDSAGRQNELAFQMDLKVREMMRDVELALLLNQPAIAQSGGTASRLAGMECWYQTNTSRGAGGANATITNGIPVTAPTDGTARSLTNDLVDDVLQSIYESGGGANRELCMLVSPAQKRNVTAFKNTSTTTGYEQTGFVDRDTMVHTRRIDVYESDYGDVKVMIDPFLKNSNAILNREGTMHIVDPDYWGVAELRPLSQYPLAKTGDNEKRQALMELTLECKNERASGVVADLS